MWEKIKAFFKAADKQFHILACAVIALAVFVLVATSGHYWWGFATAIVAAVIAGAAKEWYDYKHPTMGDFEVADIVADLLGILFAVGVMLVYCLKICPVAQ